VQAEAAFAGSTLRIRYEALLRVSQSIVAHRRLDDLFRALSECLHEVVSFDALSLTLYDPEQQCMRLHVLQTTLRHELPLGEISFPIDETPAADALGSGQPVYVPDIDSVSRWPLITDRLRAHGVRSFCVLPLIAAERKLGGLNFGSVEQNRYSDSDLVLMQQVARQVAIAVENALNYEAAAAYQRRLAREHDRVRLLLEVNNAVVRHLETHELFRTVVACLRRVLSADLVSLVLWDEKTKQLRLEVFDFPGQPPVTKGQMISLENSPPGIAFRTRKPLLFSEADIGRFDAGIGKLLRDAGFRSGCVLPLISGGRVLGTLNTGSFTPDAFAQEDVELLTQVAGQVAIAIDNAFAYKRIAELNAKLAEEKLYLEDEIRAQYQFEEIIGRSATLQRVLEQVKTVAPSDSAVLILGETGTGKELIARAIHNLSARSRATFVKVNCAAIPTGLLESELFGHEKGAFTGAISQRIGRFELADGGTLFLDEVGEIALELQPKLLRVLQESDFERLGSSRTRHVNVRVIAATNRNLLELVKRREFRDDLYYRLNVFPITLPPLRERREDIPVLVRYFAQLSARRMRKEITSIPSETMDVLVRYEWPGNIRELQNLIERAVIISPGPGLRVPLDDLRETPAGAAPPVATLEDAERRHILEALEATRWVLGGPNGAAARLGLKRSTLQFRMQKLGIARPA
jgi:formate hydrogenlyase transcriptional activator